MKLSPTQTPEVASLTHRAAAVEGIRMQASAAVMETVQAMPPTAPSGATVDLRQDTPMEAMVPLLIPMLADVVVEETVLVMLPIVPYLDIVRKQQNLGLMGLLDNKTFPNNNENMYFYTKYKYHKIDIPAKMKRRDLKFRCRILFELKKL